MCIQRRTFHLVNIEPGLPNSLSVNNDIFNDTETPEFQFAP